MTVSNRASASMSTTSIIRAWRRRHSTSSTSRKSKFCAGRRERLYGKNTTAGAINITTRQPTFDFEGRAEVSVGNLGFKQAKGLQSADLCPIPIAARVAVSGNKPPRHDLQCDDQQHLDQRAGQSRAFAVSYCGGPMTISTSPCRAISAFRTQNAARRYTSAPASRTRSAYGSAAICRARGCAKLSRRLAPSLFDRINRCRCQSERTQ